jgi:hypothetical protein
MAVSRSGLLWIYNCPATNITVANAIASRQPRLKSAQGGAQFSLYFAKLEIADDLVC